jgi:hypothetical protein
MKAEEFDQAFDRGEDVSSALDLTAAQRPGLEQRRVNVDFPVWMIESLDREARRLGVTRQSVIKVWIAEHLERRDSAAALHGRREVPRPSLSPSDRTASQRLSSCRTRSTSGTRRWRVSARLDNACPRPSLCRSSCRSRSAWTMTARSRLDSQRGQATNGER